MKNGSDENEKDGFRTASTVGWDVSSSVQLMQRMLSVRKTTAYYFFIPRKQLGSFWEKKVHICYVILNKASDKATLKDLHVVHQLPKCLLME